ncbi:MAG TPA: hypothetical protein VGM70_08285 [Pseudolysinimonas sp.]
MKNSARASVVGMLLAFRMGLSESVDTEDFRLTPSAPEHGSPSGYDTLNNSRRTIRRRAAACAADESVSRRAAPKEQRRDQRTQMP